MRNITAQYRSLLEGKISKANFMTNVRRIFPDYISATNSFEDAVKILKNKRILSEGIHDRDILSTRGMAGHVNPKSNEDAYTKMVYGPILRDIAKKMSDSEFENHLNQLGYEEYWTGDVATTIKGMDADALRHMAKELMQGDMMEGFDRYFIGTPKERLARLRNDFTYTLDGKEVVPDEIAVFNGIVRAVIGNQLYTLDLPEEGNIIGLRPYLGRLYKDDDSIEEVEGNPNIDRSLLNAEKAAEMVAQAHPSIKSDEEALKIVGDMMMKAGITKREITGALMDPDWPSDFISALRLELDIAREEMGKGAEQDFLPEAKSSKKHKPDTKEEISEKEVKAKLESKHDGKQLEAALKVFRKIDISKFKTVGEAVKEIEANAKKQFPAAFESDEEPKGKKSLKEATEKSEGSYKKVTGKDQYEVFSEIDRVNPYELKKGITMEMGMQYLPTPNYFTDHFNPDTIAKATRKALKNLQEDPAYYSNKISEPTEKRTNMHQKPKELKVGPDGGAKVKGFTAAKSNTQTNLGKKEKGSKSPEGVKEMKPSKRSMGGVKVMKSNEKLPKGVQLMEGAIEKKTQKEIDKILQKSKKKPEEGGYPATKTGEPFKPGVYSRTQPPSVTDPALSPAALKKAQQDTEAAKLTKLKEYIVAEVRKALKEADPRLQKLGSEEEKKEVELANILKQKATILSQPGTQS